MEKDGFPELPILEDNVDVVDALAEWTPDNDVEAHTASQVAEDVAIEAELETERKAQDAASDQFSASGLSVDELTACIETLLFLSDKPLSRKRLKELLGEGLDFDTFDMAIEGLRARSQSVGFGIQLVEVAGGYQFRTKP